jgi:hypothetical protein
LIADPNNFNQPGEPRDKIAGTIKKSALVLAAFEFLVYWVLVFRFPAVMAGLSVLLGAAAWYFRRAAANQPVAETMELSKRDMSLVAAYCKTWIYIAAYGTAFALFLLLRG